MTVVEPVEPGAIVRWDATGVVSSPRWAVRLVRRRMIVASGVRAATAKPLVPATALAVAAWAAARLAAGSAGRGRAIRGSVVAEAVGRVVGPVLPGATIEVTWTHLEMRWRG